jgi:hypothetical protein
MGRAGRGTAGQRVRLRLGSVVVSMGFVGKGMTSVVLGTVIRGLVSRILGGRRRMVRVGRTLRATRRVPGRSLVSAARWRVIVGAQVSFVLGRIAIVVSAFRIC